MPVNPPSVDIWLTSENHDNPLRLLKGISQVGLFFSERLHLCELENFSLKVFRMSFLQKIVAIFLGLSISIASHATDTSSWKGDLSPISNNDWNNRYAAHLLERAGFGGAPSEVSRLAAMKPDGAVDYLVNYQRIPNRLPVFDASGIYEPGFDKFPSSRPAATDMAHKTGEALGVKVKPGGNRPLQQVADKYLYWLRASMLETQRVGYWWANRMLNTQRPLEEKMTLFWHGHFATGEDKVRDYRKMLQQNELFRKHATGNFRTLLIGVAKDPAMLAFLDAGVNVKGAPNENFAREIMELFTMGVGNYSEKDIQEAARAFTGWNFNDLKFVEIKNQHDDGIKTVLGKTGNFDGVQVADIILNHPATAEYIATKLYRYFVREEVSPQMRKQLGALLKKHNYEIAPFLQVVFRSKDFYSEESIATHVKSPVEFVISTYKKLELKEVPGIVDFNEVTDSMGQKVFFPPNVAGWPEGRSWVTPGLLMIRSNFVYDTLFPPINFVAKDRVPDQFYQNIPVAEKLAMGANVSTATRPDGKEEISFSMKGDREEDFNTGLASYVAWRRAIENVKPIVRSTAKINLSEIVRRANCKTTRDVVDHFASRFVSLPLSDKVRGDIANMLEKDLGTNDISKAATYMEDALRNALHVLLALPAYQLG